MSINLVFLGLATTASPLFLLVSVLMLAQSQRLREALAMAVGWSISIGVSAGAVVLLGSAIPAEEATTKPRLLGGLDLLFAVLLGLLALRTHRRFRRDPQAAVPGWLSRVGNMSVIVSCGLGMFLPPTVISFAAGNEITQQHVAAATAWVLVVVYALIGSLLQFAPVVLVAAQPQRSAQRLQTWQGWLERHWQQVLSLLFAALSLYLLAKGSFALSR
ncbi:MAG: GAP family protein [Acidobacteria bacterium]|nr:GAP family protein [Acidobacteriota bacterium]